MSVGRWVLSAALAAHFASVLLWVWPVSAPARRLVRPYLQFTGLWQSWDMFAPDPPRANLYVEAELTMADGSTKIWAFPRLEGLGLWDKFRGDRFRKWGNDRVRRDEYRAIWPATARYVARLHANDPAGPPQAVTLVRHTRAIPDPMVLWISRGFENAVPPVDDVFFRYVVRPEDLQGPQPAH